MHGESGQVQVTESIAFEIILGLEITLMNNKRYTIAFDIKNLRLPLTLKVLPE